MNFISFIIPCYYSEHTLKGVFLEICEEMKSLPQYKYEVILVNDGSSDGTWNVIKKLTEKYKNVIGINFAKNFGQQAALMAGFKSARGDFVITVDDDGQIPVDETYKLLDKIQKGADVVYARYTHKRHSPFRNIGSVINSYMAYKLIKKPKELYMSSFLVCRKFVIDEIIKYENPFPYIGGLILQITSNIVNVEVNHRQRIEGHSGYTFKKLLKLWLNGFTNFSVKPLRVATKIGIIVASFGFLYSIFLIIRKLLTPNIIQGYASLMGAILFIGGVQMMMLGLIGEYLGRAFISINKAPQYVIKEVIEKDL